jgi:2-oxoglutarate dehydrogenase E2 component (dihydrolipoamide succinyltransferase)
MAKYQLLLPKMGESVAEATIIRWLKKPGDMIAADEAVLEIATDKVDSEVPSPVAGKLVSQHGNENDVVQVGAIVAVIETADQEEAQPAPQPVAPAPQPSFNNFQPAAPSAQASAIPGVDQLQNRPAEKAAQHIEGSGARFYSPLVRNIALQESVSSSELDSIRGTGADGRVTKDDLLGYIENRKKGRLAQPQSVQPQQPAAPEDAAPTPQPQAPQPVAQPQQPPVQQPQASPAYVQQQQPGYQHPPYPPQQPYYPPQPAPGYFPQPAPVYYGQPMPPQYYMPVAQPPYGQPYVQPEAPKGYGEESFYRSFTGEDEVIEMDRMRRIIAEHMVRSKQTSPHVTSFVEADVTNLVLWRDKVKKRFESQEGTKITFTPLFIWAVAKAIRDMPMINVSVEGTKIIKKNNINIGMATALPSGNLIVPVIREADRLNLVAITKQVNDLADRARNNKLRPDEVKDGTFTITNVGSFGNIMGTPIINQPQVAILAVGAIKKKPAVIETQSGDFIGIRHMMFLSLSYDHRVVDGALGGSFVRRVADYLERWDINREI